MNRTPVPPMLRKQKGFRRRRPVSPVVVQKKKKPDSTKRKLKLKPKTPSPSSRRKQKLKQQQRTGTGYSHIRNGTEKYNYAEIPLAQLNAFLNGPNAYNVYLKKRVMK